MSTQEFTAQAKTRAEPLLVVRGLRAGYEDIPVVFGIDLDVGEGEIVALLGANGVGKTTTLRAISGMIPRMAGKVRFGGRAVKREPPERLARMGMVHIPEGRVIFPHLAVDESLRLACATSRVPRTEIKTRLEEAYATFPPLAERRHQQAGTLSGGEQQMLGLARGLIARPRLLMVDELSQGLAPSIADSLFATVAGLPARGMSVLLVEQFVSKALELAQRAYVLKKGEVSYAGSTHDLAADADFVHSSYLGDIDVPDADVPDADVPHADGAVAGGDEAPHSALSTALPAEVLSGLEERARREGVHVADLLVRTLADSVSSEDSTRKGADDAWS